MNSTNSMTMGERLVLAARMAAEQHLAKLPVNEFEAATHCTEVPAFERRQFERHQLKYMSANYPIGGADRNRITDDPKPAMDRRLRCG